MDSETTYFGTAPLPVGRVLRAGQLTCLYERGQLRYIRWGTVEVLRMIYAALRDENWQTAPFEMENEVVEVEADRFRITYTARYQLGDIRFQGTFRLDGHSDSTLSYQMEGEALSDFWRNRIGLCVLHPVEEYRGKPVRVQHPDGTFESTRFPDSINPHQPFLNVQQLRWRLPAGAEAEVLLEGEVFETEDQRNWSDHSYKTYSTPQVLPKPVLVKSGDRLRQRVELRLLGGSQVPEAVEGQPVGFTIGAQKYPFQAIGYARSGTAAGLSTRQLELLRQVPFDHYRVEVLLEEDREADFAEAIAEALALKVPLELVVVLSAAPAAGLAHLIDTLLAQQVLVASVLVVQRGQPVAAEASWLGAYEQLKARLPGVAVGFGTTEFFTELNRNRPPEDLPFDFLSYSLNPQVHATDTRTLIENVQAQADTLATAGTFSGGQPVHVSPVTLKIRPEPGDDPASAADERQFSELTAAWTLLSLRYLAGAERLTYFETAGPLGILPAAPDEIPDPPLLGYLRRLREFGPRYVLGSQSTHPLRVDGLVLENEAGERLALLVNWEEKENTLGGDGLLPEVVLPPASVRVLQLK
jgi:D-apionolactonase